MTSKRYGGGETGAGEATARFTFPAGGIIAENRKAIENLIAVLHGAGYGIENVVRVGVWLDDPRDFWSFTGIALLIGPTELENPGAACKGRALPFFDKDRMNG
jgi:hypothetical protein